MARTERRAWVSAADSGGNMRIDPNGRDHKGRCYCCSGWKRPERRRDRHTANQALRQGKEFPARLADIA